MSATYYLIYQSADASGYADRLRSLLIDRFGPGSVFDDRRLLSSSNSFSAAGERALRESECVIVLIGPSWLPEPGDNGRRELVDRGGWLSAEITFALAAGKRLVPVLVGGARMPTADELPEGLRPLVNYQAIELGASDQSSAKLIKVLAVPRMLGAGMGARSPRAPFPASVPSDAFRPPPAASAGPRMPPDAAAKPMAGGAGVAGLFGAIGRAISGAAGSIIRRSRPTHAHPPSTPPEDLGSPADRTVIQPGKPAEPVSLGVTAPSACAPGARFTAILAAYVESSRASVGAKLQRLGGPDTSPLMGIAPDRQSGWVVGAPVTVRVTADGADVEPADRVFEWNGRENLASFSVCVRPDVTASSLVVCFHVALAGVPIAFISLPVALKAGAPSKARAIKSVRTAESAFASYSSKDTVTVDYCLSMLTRWQPGLDIFQDCLDLKPNEAFKPQLSKRIAASDVFLLFWSRSASASPWVHWEYDTARTAKGLEAVIPMPLEDPKIAPPPPEFTEVHMRDRFMMARYAMERVNEVATGTGPT